MTYTIIASTAGSASSKPVCVGWRQINVRPTMEAEPTMSRIRHLAIVAFVVLACSGVAQAQVTPGTFSTSPNTSAGSGSVFVFGSADVPAGASFVRPQISAVPRHNNPIVSGVCSASKTTDNGVDHYVLTTILLFLEVGETYDLYFDVVSNGVSYHMLIGELTVN